MSAYMKARASRAFRDSLNRKMSMVVSAGFGVVLGGLLYLMPGGVIFGFPAALLPLVFGSVSEQFSEQSIIA